MGHRPNGLLVAVAAAIAISGCAAVRQQLGAALVPVKTEIELGQELATQIEAQETVLTDATVQKYVSEVFDGLVAFSSQDRPQIPFRVRVVDDHQQVNAFALPGGPVYVYTGLLLLATDEAELAGVLAHELGHVVARHSANRLATQTGLALLTSMALGEQSAELTQLAANVLSSSTMAAFSREDEREADRYGLRYAAAAGYDPAGLETFFGKLLQLEGGQQGGVFEGLLASHPQTRERIDALRGRIQQGGHAGGKLERERYQTMRNRLLRRYRLTDQ
jgi:beta-barrel assembly-enhancing protease